MFLGQLGKDAPNTVAFNEDRAECQAGAQSRVGVRYYQTSVQAQYSSTNIVRINLKLGSPSKSRHHSIVFTCQPRKNTGTYTPHKSRESTAAQFHGPSVLPLSHLRQHHIQASLRLRSDIPRRDNFLIWIRQLELICTDKRRHEGSQLGACKVLSNARARSVYESHESEVRGRATRHVGFTCRGVDPAFRAELLGVGTPDGGIFVHGPGRHDDDGVRGHDVAQDRGLLGGDAHGQRDGGEDAQGFVADAVEERHGFKDGADVGVRCGEVGREMRVDFVAEAGLYVRVD